MKSGYNYPRAAKNPTCFLVYEGDELLTPTGIDAVGLEALETFAGKRGVTLRVFGVHEVGR